MEFSAPVEQRVEDPYHQSSPYQPHPQPQPYPYPHTHTHRADSPAHDDEDNMSDAEPTTTSNINDTDPDATQHASASASQNRHTTGYEIYQGSQQDLRRWTRAELGIDLDRGGQSWNPMLAAENWRFRRVGE
jgi:hypothetical protein